MESFRKQELRHPSTKNIATRPKINHSVFFATLSLLLVTRVCGETASASADGASTKRPDQVDLCFGGRKPTVSDADNQDGPYKKYHSAVYGGYTCCGKGTEFALSDNLVASTGASMRGLFGYCGQCAEAWEHMFFAAACSPQQGSFLKQLSLATGDKQYTLFVTPELARSLWEGCKDDDELTSVPGTHGRPLKYVYNDADLFEGVTWDAHELKAKYFVEDTVMAHTPALYLAEASVVSCAVVVDAIWAWFLLVVWRWLCGVQLVDTIQPSTGRAILLTNVISFFFPNFFFLFSSTHSSFQWYTVAYQSPSSRW